MPKASNMPEPTNRELMHLINDIKDKAGETLEQVKKTNGRVSTLENEKYFMRGGLAVISLLVVPILIYIITHYK